MAYYKEAFSQLDACLKERMAAVHTPALALALTDREQLIRLSTYGYADLNTHTPLQPDHLFAIGSVGKSFTAVAMLQACEKGLVDLHAPVTSYLPWFSVQSAYDPITLHHLLTHSSGLPRGADFSPDPRSEVYALREQEVGFAPGAHFSYSDAGYKVLGLVLEAASGRSYADFMRENIFEPLEMTSSYAVTTSALRPRMAVGCRDLYDDRPSHPSHPIVPAAFVETNSGDGCIVTTGEDMAKFARMLLNGGVGPRGALLTPGSYQKLVSPMIEEEGEAYSYGLHLFRDEGYRVAGHGGDVPGYEAYLWLDLDNGLGSVLLSSTPYPSRASFLTLEFFRAAHLGRTLPERPTLPDFTHLGNPAEYAGTYHADNGSLTLEAVNHHLLLVCGEERVALEQRGLDRFYANHPEWDQYLFNFVRSPEGKITELCYGPRWYVNERYQGPTRFEVPPEWETFAGHYRSHNPWNTNFRVFPRKDQLILADPDGEEEVLVPLGEAGCFRIGEEDYVPERLCFDQVVDGCALRATRSGGAYYRFFTP